MCSAPLGNYQLLEAKNSLEMEFWALDNLAVLDRVSIVVKRHHDQGNSYKGQHLFGVGLHWQRLSPFSPWQEAWQKEGICNTGATESHVYLKVTRKRLTYR